MPLFWIKQARCPKALGFCTQLTMSCCTGLQMISLNNGCKSVINYDLAKRLMANVPSPIAIPQNAEAILKKDTPEAVTKKVIKAASR